MNNRDKALNLLGLATKAGKLKTGESTVLESIKHSQAKLVIVASDASENTKKTFKNKCEFYNVKLYTGFTRDDISKAIGKNRTSCSLVDNGFTKSFNQLIN